MANTKVKMQTTLGDITIELDAGAAPITVKNFLEYVKDGYYDGTIFHRVIKGFMIQGGGMTKDLQNKACNEPIVNEASNGLKNKRGTIAMARTNDPDSATSQFFINHADNDFLDYRGPQPDKIGYAVFGKLTEGLDAVDKIAAVKTGHKSHYDDVPAEPVEIISVKVCS
ncbi:MAG: peptidyl-prolyl cis-trans isomerase [Planctomycetes bacterium]|nr:peptidyl-prolyl cis-trans isomerase [Planctomycetota bacterium]